MASPTPTPGPPPGTTYALLPRTLTFSAGAGATGVAFDGQDIWVANSIDHTVSRLARDGTISGTFPVGTGPFALAFDGENIWVANSGIETPGSEPLEPGTLSKLALDGTVLGTYSVGMMPSALAFDGDSIWVANLGDDTVMILDLNGNVSSTLSLGEQPRDFVFDGQNMWVLIVGPRTSARSAVSKLSLDGSVLASFPVDGFIPQALGFDGKAIWVSNGDRGTVTKRSLDGAELGTFPVGGNTLDFAFDGASMWVSDGLAGTVTALAPDGTPLGTFPAGLATTWGMAFDGEAVWVANFSVGGFGSGVTRITPDAAELVTFPVAGLPLELTAGSESMWVGQHMPDVVTKLALDGSEVATYPAGRDVGGLAYDGQHMWVADMFGESRFKTILELDDDGKRASSFESSDTAAALLQKWMTSLGDEAQAVVDDMRWCADLTYADFYAAFDGQNLWVADNSEVKKIRPTSLGDCETPVSFRIPSPEPFVYTPSGLAFDGLNIWVGSPFGITKLALDASVVDTYPIGFVQGLAFDGEFIWAGKPGDHTLSKLTLDGTEISSIPLDGDLKALAFGGEHIWVALGGRFAVTRMSLDGAELVTFPVVIGDLSALAFDGENLWVADADSGAVDHGIEKEYSGEDVVVKLAPDGTVLGAFRVGPDPSALVFDGKNITVTLGNDTWVVLSLDGTKLGTFSLDGLDPRDCATFDWDSFPWSGLEKFDGQSIWSIGDEEVTRVAQPCTIMDTVFADGVGYQTHTAFDHERIWIGDRSHLLTISLALRDLFILDNFPIGAEDLAFDGNSMWIATPDERTVSRLTLLKPHPLLRE